MNELGTAFAVPSEAAGQEALKALQQRFEVREETDPRRVVTYYDTFDWRLYRDGGTLSTAPAELGPMLTWRDLDGEVRHRLTVEAVPAFAWDLPAGALRDALARVIEMRRLLPVAELRLRGRTLRLVDGEEKTVARVRLEERSAGVPGRSGAPEPLPPILRVLPVRGYGEAGSLAASFLADELGLERTGADPFAEAAAAGGREPGGYSGKVTLALDPAQPAAEAARAIHRSLLATIRANEDGVRQDLDSEFLHDFRVAVRRTRSALTQIKGVFPAAAVGRFKSEFKWLGTLTGPTRDLDVYLLKMDGYGEALPPAVRRDLEPLRGFLEEHQRQEQRRLAAGLEDGRYRRLLDDWEGFLGGRDRPEAAGGEAPNAERPVGEVASERIWKVYRRVLKKGRRIDEDTPDEALHELRIECKKLRYLMEFFRSLYRPADIARLIKALKGLQDNLGDFNDYVVQQEHLRSFARQMLAERTATAETLMAMGRLVARLERGHGEERRRFSERFAKFAGRRNVRRARTLFGPR